MLSWEDKATPVNLTHLLRVKPYKEKMGGTYDAYADRAQATDTNTSSGTGAAAGWTACPLCVRKLQARGKG
jgi:hypothetical protein